MDFYIVEIGTSNFNLEKCPPGSNVLYVEPVLEYLKSAEQQAKEKGINIFTDQCIVLPHTIEDFPDELPIYFISIENCEKYNLPQWIRGCNMVGQIHVETEIYLKQNKIDLSIVENYMVKTKTMDEVFADNNVASCSILKTDMEGYDAVVAVSTAQLLDDSLMPDIFIFESNHLNSRHNILLAIELWRDRDYTLVGRGANTILRKIKYNVLEGINDEN